MHRADKPDLMNRDALRILVKQLIERTGELGITKQELLDQIGPARTSLRSIQRAIDDLRDLYEADLVSFGKIRRWRFLSALRMPLDAPTPLDLRALLRLHGYAKPLLSDEENEAITRMLEELDARARNHASPSELPLANVLTSSFSQAAYVDSKIFTPLLLACRRKTMRIRYKSPWPDTPVAGWHVIEPWAIHIHDTTHYLYVWSVTANEARTFNLAHIEILEDVEDAPPRQPIPKNPRATSRAFGIDSDQPGIAVIHMRGQVARWQATMTWHPEQHDEWLPDGVFERDVPFHSRREIARFLAEIVDGTVAIGPPELAEAVMAHCAAAQYIVKLPARPREPAADGGD